jgi:hypothetical protein
MYLDVVWIDCHLDHGLVIFIIQNSYKNKWFTIPRYFIAWYSPWLAILSGTPFQAGEDDVIQCSATSHPPILTPWIGTWPALISSFSCWSEL